MSVKSKVLAYLSKDSAYNTLTANKMQSVYLNTRINASGEKVSFYRLGKPTKRMVAEGIASIRSQGERAFA
jgi:hypothetical protein